MSILPALADARVDTPAFDHDRFTDLAVAPLPPAAGVFVVDDQEGFLRRCCLIRVLPLDPLLRRRAGSLDAAS